MSLEARLRGKKAVIFDMEGVIIDTEKIWKQAEKEVFTALGVKVTNENSKVTEVMTTTEVAHYWFAQFPWKGKSLQEAEQLVIQRVSALIETEECLIDGVKRFLEGLRSQNYKIGLATNSPQEIIPTVLRRLEITHLFDAVSSAEMEEKGKPHPAVYLSTARKLNVTPKGCLVIEDSYSGMMAAKNAGMEVAAFTNGNQLLNFEIADCHILNY